MISVIVLVNSKTYLKECISNILSQSYKNIELICLLDSNDKESLDLLNSEFNVDDFKIIINKGKKDKSISKNIGLKYANGEYVIFLEDTQLEKDALKTFSDIANKEDVDLVISNIKSGECGEDYLNDYKSICNKVINNYEFPSDFLFDVLENPFLFFYKKYILTEDNFEFYKESDFMNVELSNMWAIFQSNELYILDKPVSVKYDVPPNKINTKLNTRSFKEVIDLFISDKKVYEMYHKAIWGYIFNNIFTFVYNMWNGNPAAKRERFYDAKVLYDEYYANKGFFYDISDNLDLASLEFFSQSLEDAYYVPKKRDVLTKLCNEDFNSLKIAIKSPNPIDNRRYGDYFFALALKKSFEKKGFKVIVHELDHWYDRNDNEDIVLVLRGLERYIPNEKHINLMWNISHPDAVKPEEYNAYDIVFISSLSYADTLDKKLDTVVKPLLQCTDPEVFYPKYNQDYEEDILFVGKTRRIYRQIIKDISKTSHDFSIYGGGWERFIDKKFIKGEFIPNNILNQYYSSCKILLNDHWDYMRDLDFPSNRLFDALACGTFVISDEINSAKEIFENTVITYKDADDLDKKLTFYLENENERTKLKENGRKIVLSKHTFDHRAEEIIKTLEQIIF